MDAQLKKGVLDMCILYNVNKSESVYGYTLIKEITALFPEVNDSTIYTILRRLNKGGYLDYNLQESATGPKRKYYFITEIGRELLATQRADWKELIGILGELDL